MTHDYTIFLWLELFFVRFMDDVLVVARDAETEG